MPAASAPARLTRGAQGRACPPPIGHVHLGLGAFARAHPLLYTEDAIAAAGGEWGVCGVAQRRRTLVDALRRQDGLYAVLERHPDGPRARVVGVLADAFVAADEPDRLADLLAVPATAVVTVTVTEKGYRRDQATGRLDLADGEIQADLDGRPPLTPVGQLARGLVRRRAAGHDTPLTVLSCDNVTGNGPMLAALVTEFCERLPTGTGGGAGLARWVAEHARFPSTVVDRVVPAPTERDRADAAALLGLADDAAVAAEPYRHWVIDEAACGVSRPAWEQAGAQFVADVRPFETTKLRLVNGVHSVLAYLGGLAGLDTIGRAYADDVLGPFAGRLVAEDLLPTVRPTPELDPSAYWASVDERLRNPAIVHRVEQVATDGSAKLGGRLFAPAAERLAAGAAPRWIALAVAGWLRYLGGYADDGRPLPVHDPLAERLTWLAAEGRRPTAVVDGVLGEVAPPDLAGDEVFRGLVRDWLGELTAHGVRQTLRAV